MGAACTPLAARAARTQAPALPLRNLGLEHLDIVVPDTALSARFYMRVFDTALHQQPFQGSIRYFILLGDLPADRQVGYIAIGAAGDRPVQVGHYCALAETYEREAVAAALEAAGYPAPSGGFGMIPDVDGIELQLFTLPAGLVTAAVPSDLEVEAANPNRIWFQLERETRIGLEPAAAGETPRIERFGIKVMPFDRAVVADGLRTIGAEVLSGPEEPGLVRFRDNYGITLELNAV
jgi:hypothetical protein